MRVIRPAVSAAAEHRRGVAMAHRTGRTQRLDAARSAKVVEAVLAAADAPSESASALRRVAR